MYLTIYTADSHGSIRQQLPTLYQEVIGHPNASDELRRATEAKLLQHKQQLLYALTSSDDMSTKLKLSQEVQELISGIVLLNIPNELAWNLHIQGIDASSIGESHAVSSFSD